LSKYSGFCLERKALLMAGLFFMSFLNVYAQHKTKGDSLERVYSSGSFEPHEELGILKELAVTHSNTDKRLQYSEQLIQLARELDSANYLFQGYLEKGNALRLKSDLSQALESYFEGAKIVENGKNTSRLGAVYIAIADVYSIMGNNENAIRYHQNAIRILRREGDSLKVATALLNAGDGYITMERLDSALVYTMEAESIFKKINSRLGQAYSLGNLGMIYAKLGINLKAEYYMNLAMILLQDLNEYYPIAVYLTYISDIYLERGEAALALNYASQSLELAQKHGMKKQVSDAYLTLSKIYERLGKPEQAFMYYRDHITYKDSVNNITAVQQMADIRTDFEVSKKQIEVDLLNQQKKTQQIIVVAIVIALGLISLLALGLYRRYKYIRVTNKIIEREKNRSDILLLNILPKETAQELKLNGKVTAKRFESVTVLFADFKGFTQHAENLSPETLVETVDYYFSRFDLIMERHGLEKIKTIGDAYMCAGGLPFPTEDHAVRMVRASFEMAEFVQEAKKTNPGNKTRFDVRIGINTGPVVAGIVGTKKFAYDIWGDTVNIASHMETNSEPGRINVSENTYALIKDVFPCAYRGEMEVKNRGIMKMYFVQNESVLAAAPSVSESRQSMPPL